MQNFTSFVNEHLTWEEASLHRNDCHDPPRVAHVGFHDDISPPRRLSAVARSGPWKATLGFPREATRRRRLPRVAGSDRWNTGSGKDSLWRHRRGGDCHPVKEFCAVAGLPTMKVGEYGLWQSHGQISYSPRGCFLVVVALASVRTRVTTSSWSLCFNLLKVSMSLYSRLSGLAIFSTGIASGFSSPSRNSWYVSISRAFAILSRFSMLGTVCPFSTLEV